MKSTFPLTILILFTGYSQPSITCSKLTIEYIYIYMKALHLGCCSSPRSASAFRNRRPSIDPTFQNPLRASLVVGRGASRAAVTSRMECFVIIFNGGIFFNKIKDCNACFEYDTFHNNLKYIVYE